MTNDVYRAIYHSPYTDKPNKILIGDPLTIEEMFHDLNGQVNFHDGGYLRFDEIEELYTRWDMWMGIEDKNGIKIFKNDIVRYNDTEGNVYIHLVMYDTGYLCWTFDDMPYIKIKKSGYFQDMNLEVIGNIYENKELLSE